MSQTCPWKREEGGCVDILPNTKSRGTLSVIKFYMKFRLKFTGNISSGSGVHKRQCLGLFMDATWMTEAGQT